MRDIWAELAYRAKFNEEFAAECAKPRATVWSRLCERKGWPFLTCFAAVLIEGPHDQEHLDAMADRMIDQLRAGGWERHA